VIRLCDATDHYRGASGLLRPCVLEAGHDAATPHEDYLGATWHDRVPLRAIDLVPERKPAAS
jgi:hypothetical protein